MNTAQILELFCYTLPALVTGVIAYRFFGLFIKSENKKFRFLLENKASQDALPIRLQAYERMTLFLERINLNKLVLRVAPLSEDKNLYENLLIEHIEQEFEHNLTQQIYMTEECWTVITTAKNATIQIIRKTTMNERVENAFKLREKILNDLLEKQSPSHGALSYIKNEINISLF
ncbi:DUF7935 family protein [Flavobacterium agrisoli]|uniref:Uncharacterized protein n=1 Tax=Flavobacterium agrisoli TaxID=2793066 RepID=A0A934UIF7_9FLAO|nr:hypothetical protein [Flavobacterium agrisoli]MBK0368340.1 hypothetical protein [Flavobacterium agrisoli]